jgi:hypothetical protein
MYPITKKRILRLIERAGYVVTKVADHHRREQLISERIAQLEKVRAALAKELDQQRDRALLAARKLSEIDCECRLGRERDARELETARAETWELRVVAAELQHQLDGVQRERSEHDDLLEHIPATAAGEQVGGVPQDRGELNDRSQLLD